MGVSGIRVYAVCQPGWGTCTHAYPRLTGPNGFMTAESLYVTGITGITGFWANPPDLSNTWSWRGAILYKLGRYEEAITCCEEATRLAPDNKYAYNIKGLIFTELGKRQEAIEFFNNAIAIDPMFAEAINNKNGLIINQGQNAYSGEMPIDSTQRYGFSGTPAHSVLVRPNGCTQTENGLICNGDTGSSGFGFGYGGIGGIAMTKQ